MLLDFCIIISTGVSLWPVAWCWTVVQPLVLFLGEAVLYQLDIEETTVSGLTSQCSISSAETLAEHTHPRANCYTPKTEQVLLYHSFCVSQSAREKAKIRLPTTWWLALSPDRGRMKFGSWSVTGQPCMPTSMLKVWRVFNISVVLFCFSCIDIVAIIRHHANVFLKVIALIAESFAVFKNLNLPSARLD